MSETSKRQFEETYARRSGISVRCLRKMGRRVFRCACGDATCPGWQSINPVDYWEDRIFREPHRWNRLWMRIAVLFWKIRLLRWLAKG